MGGVDYIQSLRHASTTINKTTDTGTPCFAELNKVKTTAICQATSKDLLFAFEFVKGEDGIPYRKQGNEKYSAPKFVATRSSIQSDLEVQNLMLKFWDTFDAVRCSESKHITKSDFVNVFVKMFKALVAPQEFCLKEATKIVEGDWKRDVGKGDLMSKSLFLKSLFEVVDIWTPDIRTESYREFLIKLFSRITISQYDKKNGEWIQLFKPLEEIVSFSEVPTEIVDNNLNKALKKGNDFLPSIYQMGKPDQLDQLLEKKKSKPPQEDNEQNPKKSTFLVSKAPERRVRKASMTMQDLVVRRNGLNILQGTDFLDIRSPDELLNRYKEHKFRRRR